MLHLLRSRWSGTQQCEFRKAIKPVNLGSVRFKVKALPKEFRLGSSRQSLVLWAFQRLPFANSRRDNQPNDASGNSTRRRTGGNGGRIVEPVRELSSLLSQAFVQEYKDDASLLLPLAMDGSD